MRAHMSQARLKLILKVSKQLVTLYQSIKVFALCKEVDISHINMFITTQSGFYHYAQCL